MVSVDKEDVVVVVGLLISYLSTKQKDEIESMKEDKKGRDRNRLC